MFATMNIYGRTTVTSGERYSVRCFTFVRGYIKKGTSRKRTARTALFQTAYEIIMLSIRLLRLFHGCLTFAMKIYKASGKCKCHSIYCA